MGAVSVHAAAETRHTSPNRAAVTQTCSVDFAAKRLLFSPNMNYD